MPPKDSGMSKKTENKKKEKVVEDLTFGLKNKNKSKVVQQYVKEVTNKVMFSQVKGGAKAVEEQQREKKEAQKKKEEQQALLQSLFKQVTQIQTTESGEIDYKATLCPYFKSGVCEKGKRCKYSHDMSVAEQQQSNIDIYSDPRAKIGKVPDTIITCKNFIEAVEKELYGFNWVCPNNGDDCTYMHRLPLGYVLVRDRKVKMPGDEDSDEEMTLEEKIEKERHELPSEGLIPVTLETFMKWKADRAERKQKEAEERMQQEMLKATTKGGNKNFGAGVMSGKALFTFDPSLFQDDDGAANEDNYEEASDDEMTINTTHQQQEESKDGAEPEVDEDLFNQEQGAEEEDVDFD